MPRMTPDELALIEAAKARAEAATVPPPWKSDGAPNAPYDPFATVYSYDAEGYQGEVIAGSVAPANAAFIAHARTDVPALCALALRLVAKVAELTAENERLRAELAARNRVNRRSGGQ